MKSRANNLSILILVTQYELAGAQKNAFTQARYLSSRGYNVILAFLYDKYNKLDSHYSNQPFEIVNLEAKKSGANIIQNAIAFGRACVRLYWLLRKSKVEIIETLTHYSNICGIIIGWLANVPVRISSQRNTLPDFPGWYLKLDALIVNSPLVTKMICVSESTRDFCTQVEGMNPSKLEVIPNGIDVGKYNLGKLGSDKNALRKQLSLPIDDSIILSIGRLHPQKGFQYLIEAAEILIKKFPKTTFIIIGSGNLEDELIEIIQSKELGEHVKLLGIRTDIPELLNASDIFVLPSLYEGMPNVLLEAMAAGLPVVATNVDGSGEIVIDKVTGYLVPPADSQALACSIQSILCNPYLSISFSQAGYQRVLDRFSEIRMCEAYENALLSSYRAILK